MKNITINTHSNDSLGHSHKAFTLHLLRAPQPKSSHSFFSRVLGNVCILPPPALLCISFLAAHVSNARLKLCALISCSYNALAPWLTMRWYSGQRPWGLKLWTFGFYCRSPLSLRFWCLGRADESHVVAWTTDLQSWFAWEERKGRY